MVSFQIVRHFQSLYQTFQGIPQEFPLTGSKASTGTGENVVAAGCLGPGVCILEQARAGPAANLQLDKDAQESLLGSLHPETGTS